MSQNELLQIAGHLPGLLERQTMSAVLENYRHVHLV
jgi:hypothetical protein